MKKIFLLLIALSITASSLAGCTPRYGKYRPESKDALRTIAGGLLGALAAGNTGGAIVGAFVADIYNISYVKYEDKKLEDNEEASRKRNDKIKEAEQKREQDRKADKEKPADQKADKERPEDQKADKYRVERAKFSIEEFMVSAQTVRSGSPMEAKVQYMVHTPGDDHEIKLTETRIFFAADRRIELDKREIYRKGGRYISVIKFRVPEDLPKGYCILYTILSDGKRSKTEKTVINII